MPSLAKHRCHRCKRIVVGRCACGQKQYDQLRGTSASRGYGSQWREYRRVFLSEFPICHDCLVAPATDVHHIRKLREYPEGQYEVSNCMALCHACHAVRTAKGE